MENTVESTANEVEIVRLRRISQSQPTAWEGETRNQQAVHIFYKYGRLEVWLHCPVRRVAGAFKWVTIVSFYPEWLETEVEIERNWAGMHRNGSLATAKREAWLLFERRMVAEMQSDKPDAPRPRRRIITVGQLAHWLALRNKEIGRRNGFAPHGIRVEVTAWTDQP